MLNYQRVSPQRPKNDDSFCDTGFWICFDMFCHVVIVWELHLLLYLLKGQISVADSYVKTDQDHDGVTGSFQSASVGQDTDSCQGMSEPFPHCHNINKIPKDRFSK